MKLKRRVPIMAVATTAMLGALACAPPVSGGQRISMLQARSATVANATVSLNRLEAKRIGEDANFMYFAVGAEMVATSRDDNDLKKFEIRVLPAFGGSKWSGAKTAGGNVPNCATSATNLNVSAFGFGGGLSLGHSTCPGEAVGIVADSWATARWNVQDKVPVDGTRGIPLAFVMAIPKPVITAWKPSFTVSLTVDTEVCGSFGCNSAKTSGVDYRIEGADFGGWQ